MKKPLTIFTVGHSTRLIGEFVEILKAHGVQSVADVRTIPKSRHNPQFNGDTLPGILHENEIGYAHLSALGGLRHARKDSVNDGWKNASFRGFADYMLTGEFERGLEQLLETAGKRATAIMCAEAVPWRCHRSLIGDALLVRGITVVDIMSKSAARQHILTPWALVEGERITYPGTRKKNGAP